MRIEKLNENKIRFILNIEDLKEKNIDYHSFMSNSIETQDLFLDMLEQAETEIGFKTENYKLIIEALATSDGNFILTVTRIEDDSHKKMSKKGVKIKRKNTTPNKQLSIYKFNSFDDFCEFCTYITNILPLTYKKIKNSFLYLYNDNYYLILNNTRISIADFKMFNTTITEFATFVNDATLLERKIKEYGKLIINEHAIATGHKYFS